MEPIKSVSEAKRAIESYQGAPEEFALAISDELQDPLGMNMAIIGDCILAKDWLPNGFDQRQGFRVYRFKSLE